MKTATKFGTYLRAARLGYHEIPDLLGVWVKIDAGGPPWRTCVALTPEEMGRQSGLGHRNYICWWEGDQDAKKMRAASIPLARVLEETYTSKVGCVVIIDDDGHIGRREE